MTEERRGFVHLHVHSEYSLLDGACRLSEKRDPTEEEMAARREKDSDLGKIYKEVSAHPLVDAAMRKGQKAIALTDHGNMFGGYKFLTYGAELRKKTGFNSIIGCEIYLAEDMYKTSGYKGDDDSGVLGNYTHLILLAKDYQGYLNLCKIVSLGYTDGFYNKPRVDMTVIHQYAEGLICLSGCIAGKIPRLIKNNQYEEAKAFALELKELFREDFYIELQDHDLDDEKYVLPQLIKLAREIGVKCVATNDVHYIEREDSEMHHTLVSIRARKMADGYKPYEFYMRTEEEMLERFHFFPEAVWNTVEVADKCMVELPDKQWLLPVYQGEEKTRLQMSSKEYLRYKTKQGLIRRYGDNYPEHIEARVQEELRVIEFKMFEDYFLVVWDFINYAKSIGIPVGPGRGSGAGSVVAYAMGITDVEPLQYNLLFERFLDEGRPDYPDFDIDFCCERRQEVIDYVCRLYGADNTCRIATFGTLKAKQAFKDVCRVFDIPLSEVIRIAKYIPPTIKRFEHLLHPHYDAQEGKLVSPNDEILALYRNDPRFKKIFDIIVKIDSMPRQPGMHAAGVIICNYPVSDYVPLATNVNNGVRNIITQYDKTEVEPVGLLKMDFLGLITLTDIHYACQYVKENHGVELDFSKMGVNDPEVFKCISEGHTEGIFQLEGGGMTKFMTELKPTSIEDIIAGISIYRPGPMEYKDVFVRNKQDPSQITYLTPEMAHILDVTYGIIVYQEQAMQMARDLAGYTMKEANEFRGVIAKKKLDKMPAQRERFIKGCVANGIAEPIAIKIFDQLKSFCSYAFNKSHAAAYAYVGYQTAYLRRYYPAELFTAILNDNINSADKISKYIKIVSEVLNLPVLPPDVNKSRVDFYTDGKSVRYGLMAVKNVGKNVVEVIVNERNRGGEYANMSDFVKRVMEAMRDAGAGNLNKRMIECLIYAGAFDSFGETRCTLINNYEAICALEESARKTRDEGQFSMFDDYVNGTASYQPYDYSYYKEYPQRERLRKEKEMLGHYVSGHPLEGYEEQFRQFNFNTSMVADRYAKVGEEPEEGAVIIEEEDDEDKVEDAAVYDRMPVEFGGIREKAQVRRTKDGKEFCIFNVEDMYGIIEVVVYASTYQRYKRVLDDDILITNEMVKVKGLLSLRDGEPPKVTANSVEVWDIKEISQQLTQKEIAVAESHKMVFIAFDPGYTGGEYVLGVLAQHPGPYQVGFKIDNQFFRYDNTVGDLNDLVRELRALVGYQNVRIIDKDELLRC